MIGLGKGLPRDKYLSSGEAAVQYTVLYTADFSASSTETWDITQGGADSTLQFGQTVGGRTDCIKYTEAGTGQSSNPSMRKDDGVGSGPSAGDVTRVEFDIYSSRATQFQGAWGFTNLTDTTKFTNSGLSIPANTWTTITLDSVDGQGWQSNFLFNYATAEFFLGVNTAQQDGDFFACSSLVISYVPS